MRDNSSWAARYQLLAELWRGRDRVVFDPWLERRVLAWGRRGSGLDEATRALLDDLLPAVDVREGGNVWMILADGERAGELSRLRPGVVFLGVDEASSVLAEEPWLVAMLEVGELVVGAGDPKTGRDVAAWTEALLDAVDDHRETRTVVVGASDPNGEDPYEALRALTDVHLPGATIYGIARANVMVAYALASDEAEDGDDDVEFDNGLGSDPSFVEYLAVSGPLSPRAALVYVELPGEPALDATPSGDEAMRTQLREATEQAQREAIARQALLEELDEARERIAELEDRLAGVGTSGAAAAPVDARLDAALAREQHLRWEVARLEAELEQARAAEVTSQELAYEARVVAREGDDAEREGDDEAEFEDQADGDEPEVGDEDGDEWDEDDGVRLVVDLGEDERDRRLRGWETLRRRCLAQLEGTLRRVERAGLTGLELHRALSQIRGVLRRGGR